MLWSAFLLCFFGFLRPGEVTISDASSYDPAVHLNFNDISTDNPHSPNIIRVCIKASKTDPFVMVLMFILEEPIILYAPYPQC